MPLLAPSLEASGVQVGSLLMLMTLVPRTPRLTFPATLCLDGRGRGPEAQ